MGFLTEPMIFGGDGVLIGGGPDHEMEFMRYGLWIPLWGVNGERKKDLIHFLEKHYPDISDKLTSRF